MKIWKKLLIQALAAGLIGGGECAQGAQDPQKKATQEGPQKKELQSQGSQEKVSPAKIVPGNASQQKVAPNKGPQAKSTGDFRKLDASALPITQKIQIGGDADWLGYGIGIGVDRVWVLNCQSKTLTRINPKTNAVDLRVPVKIDDGGEGSIALDDRYVWFASDDDGHASTLMQIDAKTGHQLKRIAVGKDSAVVKLGFGSVWVISSGEGNVYRVDPARGKVTAMIAVADGPRFSTVAG